MGAAFWLIGGQRLGCLIGAVTVQETTVNRGQVLQSGVVYYLIYYYYVAPDS
jgi:hypothetical protein